MIFPQTVEYAFRIMAQMATAQETVPARAVDLSEQTGIPLPYLSKIMRRLVEAGLVESQKGHGGGFRVSRDPSSIRFADILHAVDFEMKSARCAFGWEACNEQQPCPLHPYWKDLKENFNRWAEDYSLEDVRQGNCNIPATGALPE